MPSKKRYKNNAQLNEGETYSVVVVVGKLARTQQRITVALVDTYTSIYVSTARIKQKTYTMHTHNRIVSLCCYFYLRNLFSSTMRLDEINNVLIIYQDVYITVLSRPKIPFIFNTPHMIRL